MTTPAPDISPDAVEQFIARKWKCVAYHRGDSGHFELSEDGAWMLAREAEPMLRALRTALTARDEALASIRVFAQDCIDNGYFDKGALGNLYSIRDLCDTKGENLR